VDVFGLLNLRFMLTVISKLVFHRRSLAVFGELLRLQGLRVGQSQADIPLTSRSILKAPQRLKQREFLERLLIN